MQLPLELTIVLSIKLQPIGLYYNILAVNHLSLNLLQSTICRWITICLWITINFVVASTKTIQQRSSLL